MLEVVVVSGFWFEVLLFGVFELGLNCLFCLFVCLVLCYCGFVSVLF